MAYFKALAEQNDSDAGLAKLLRVKDRTPGNESNMERRNNRGK